MEKEETIIGGRYEYIRPLGKGGNGSVFLCYDIKLHKEWAVKKLCISKGTDQRSEAIANNRKQKEEAPELLSELEALKTVSCNVFPRIVDVIQENENIYLVMDYVKGITLKEKMERGKLTEKEVLPWAVEIAKALRYLHQMSPQILYLDCKPENIMLTAENEIRLVDLGSAYVCQTGKKQRLSGTYFFAPEELRDRKGSRQMPDVRTDIYIFGMTLYCLLAGKKKEYRRNGRLRVRDVNPNVSYGMNAIIAKCTEKEQQKRYQSMEEVLYQLTHIKELGRQEKGKSSLRKTAGLLIEIFLISGCLLLTGQYMAGGQIIHLLLSLFLACFLLVLCKLRKSAVYEVKQDIFCGSGKRILSLAILCPCLIASLHLTSYAAQTKEESGLPVTIYDEYRRKILIKDGSSWGVEKDILLSVPVEEISENGGKITIIYTDESGGESKKYTFKCHRK